MPKRANYNKHDILGKIFNKKFAGVPSQQPEIEIYFDDIKTAARQLSQTLPVSISNFILDLCRKNNGLEARVPEVVRNAGYDLKKATGNSSKKHRKRLAGRFVYVGVGKEVQSWLIWPIPNHVIMIDSRQLPPLVRRLLRRDEAAMFSVFDYLDVLSQALGLSSNGIQRLQAPMKWQPNEIDGLYFRDAEANLTLYPVEAKALTTNDEINFEQLVGGYRVVVDKMGSDSEAASIDVVQIAAQMVTNGVRLAVFPKNVEPQQSNIANCIQVTFDPPITAWS